MTDNDHNGKSNGIFNVNELGLQLNNNPGHVLAKIAVSTVTSIEKRETIIVNGLDVVMPMALFCHLHV